MKNIFKKLVKKILLTQHLQISRNTDKSKLLEFLLSVKPIKTNHTLIRLGGETDGGYLIPNDIENIDKCFSPGVSEVANFENDLTKKNSF
jgi:hypothetical protein